MIDLLRAGEVIMREMRHPQAALRIIPGGVRFESPALRVDLLTDRIRLADAAELSRARRFLLRAALRQIVPALGFRAVADGKLDDKLPAGTLLAAHPIVLEPPALTAAPPEPSIVVEADRETGNPPIDMPDETEVLAENTDVEEIEEDDGPGLG